MTPEAGPPGVSVPALAEFLHEHVPGLLSGPLRVELLAGGRSNLTYLLGDGSGRWVLRRPPLGHVLATAHDMGREFRVLAALHPSAVPVPRPIVQGDADVFGAPFYVMTFADGAVLRERHQLESLGAAEAARLADALVDVLARLHATDPAAVGLGDLGRPDGYLERQLRRWAKQLAASHSRDLPELTALAGRLGQRVPETGAAAIVHGDYRLDNLVVDPAGGQVVAVLDWEMATLGDPLADLASAVAWWDGPDNPVATTPARVPGFPSAGFLVEAYARRSGRDLAALPWYLGFAYYKIAAIFEGIHYRARQGLTVGEGFDRLGELVPGLAERGHTALDGDLAAIR
ncbi:phosphotransferase family protein [Amycolatopsis sp. OK19-0408]|uniref:Phosphotransferase family protein n=1 Tax=Amycolatopsis iheyensis TaxID=2945988 RepID=A0A9X2NDX1_9PSEU|nr:phosphotransferase family protein [Amycolatopsis iheyensis]MCR6485075.1 phosphotransferase family protein [Amycolatopsis iheyensis]